jgi:branched-chain amino acid transport system ATP-binding protein
MLAIGRALMLLPKILLMDEPSLGLAPLVVSLVFNIIKSFREEGYSILLIEQNAKKALQVSDRGYVLENGVFVAKDRCQNLLTNENIKKAYLGA